MATDGAVPLYRRRLTRCLRRSARHLGPSGGGRATAATAAGHWPTHLAAPLAALLAREDLTADDTRWAMTEVIDNARERPSSRPSSSPFAP